MLELAYGGTPKEKPLEWMGSSLDAIRDVPEDVKDEFGFALYEAQKGKMPKRAKPLSGVGGGVFEVVSDDDGSTYRAVYTARLKWAIYVLHVFQKKSTKGIKTPKKEIDLIKSRLKDAIKHHEEKYEQKLKKKRDGPASR